MSAKYVDERLSLPVQYTPGKIGVVTVLFNSEGVLEDFFDSLEGQHYTSFVVYCVDNASSDNSADQCRARGERYVVIENQENVGVAAGNNIGTRRAIADGCEFVMYLNNDVVFGPELFDQLVEGLSLYKCSMTTPIMYYHDRPNMIWAAGGYFQPWFGYRCLHYGDGDHDRGQYDLPRQVKYTPTCCVLVRRDLFSTIGIMDERYFAYWDDTDFMLRAHQFGEILYLLPYAKLWHKVSSSTGINSPFRTRYVHRNHALYGHKHLPPSIAYLISFIYCTGYLLLSLVRRISLSNATDRIKYWREGIRASRYL
ncbi:glycosyltransferase family 2 protein [Edaphobacter albus]|uniref:glycosyltransferase family 2 protein n=1 Tax=Edaphobacter sp. 4G125 TaxID=2763071 RepID=UPI0016471E73|nr:glycosyltransferase family 2 protein [Edaphobacter sp. 4G125]QNI37175.1 glycosyltransferase family 2 protein [Edaphobacter sp. 4G125]